MLQNKIHMRDQIANRVELIMEDDRSSLVERLEEFATSVIFMAIVIFLIRV